MREAFGADEVPDLPFVNYKMIDYISHVWTVNSPEMQDASARRTRRSEDLVGFLNGRLETGRVGHRAHRGSRLPSGPAGDGGVPDLGDPDLERHQRTLDTDGDETRIVELIQPTQMFVDEAEAAAERLDLEDVSRWIIGLTKAYGRRPACIPASRPTTQDARPRSPRRCSSLPCLPEARA